MPSWMSQDSFSWQRTSWCPTNAGGNMRRKWTLLLAIGALPHIAHADWCPTPWYDNYVVTVGASVNGSYGEITYSEDRYSGNYLPSIARDVYSITNSLSNELDTQVRQMAAREGLNFIYGNLYGESNVTLQPNGAGYLTTRITGLNYQGRASGTKRSGIFSATCTVNVSITNIIANAQIGSATGGIPEDTVGVTADVGSNASCSTNIGWIPIIGLVADIWLEHKVNGMVKTSARDLIASMKDKLFFERDANAYAGLN